MDLVLLLSLAATICLISLTFSVHAVTDVLELGSSLTPASQPLLSASSNFTLSFRDPAPLFRSSTLFLAIYFFVDSSPNNPVWVANRNTSVSVSASLNLSSSGDLLLLTDRSVPSSLVWSSNTADRNVVQAQLLDTGNLVLLNDRGEFVWQSFHYPTDTILSGQEFSANSTALISSKKLGDFQPGRYSFNFTSLVEVYNIQYRSTVGNVSAMHFDDNGNITFYGSDTILGSATSISNDYGVSSSMRRMTLDMDGNLRLYTWDVSSAQWTGVWMLFSDLCTQQQQPGFCGSYGVCTYDPFEPKCVCPQGFSVVDPTDLSGGCTSASAATADKCNASNSTMFMFQELENVDFPQNDFLFQNALITIEECKNECLTSCECLAAVYGQTEGSCWLKQKVENGHVRMDQSRRVFLKVLASDPLVLSPIVDRATRWKLGQYLWQPLLTYSKNPSVYSSTIKALVVLIIIEGICFAATVSGLLISSSKRKLKLAQLGEELDVGPHAYSYQDLMVATDNFRHKLGEGGFGMVYKGQLQGGKRIAVKLLEGLHQQEKQFRAEIMTIGRIHHINLLRLVGFCYEGNHRLLVYEYMERGSLDQFLLQENSGNGSADFRHIEVLDWSTRFSICLGVAKGIQYLHEGCLNCILHCDIKPHNVLLDGSYCAKVADFGLAYLHNRDQTVEMTTIRGTRGYLAPEWISNLPITAKADVFSYGMLIMEIISGRSNYLYTNSSASVKDKVSEKWCFPMWAYGKRIQDVVDAKLQKISIDWKQAEIVLKVAFACIQEDMNARPTMGQVLQMLEGVLPLPVDLPPPSLIPTNKRVAGATLSPPSQVFSITKSSSASSS